MVIIYLFMCLMQSGHKAKLGHVAKPISMSKLLSVC